MREKNGSKKSPEAYAYLACFRNWEGSAPGADKGNKWKRLVGDKSQRGNREPRASLEKKEPLYTFNYEYITLNVECYPFFLSTFTTTE